MKLLEEDEDQVKRFEALIRIEYRSLIDQQEDYKKRLDGHLEDISQRDKEIKFLK